jgi:CRP-like cAMP-binding protein
VKSQSRCHQAIIRNEKIDLIHGEVLFLPAMPMTAIFLVEKGGVLVFSSGSAELSRIIISGQVIGLQDLLSHGHWSGLGVAHGPTRLRVFPTDRLRESIYGAPQAHQALLRALAGV